MTTTIAPAMIGVPTAKCRTRARARVTRQTSRAHFANNRLEWKQSDIPAKTRFRTRFRNVEMHNSLPDSDLDVHVRDTPASFCSRLPPPPRPPRPPPPSPPSPLPPTPSFSPLVSTVARGAPVVAAFTRDAMPPDARSSRRGAAKNDHQVSRLPLCTHIYECARV